MTHQHTTKPDDQASLRDCHHACGIAKKLGNHSGRLEKLHARLSARCYDQGTKEEGGSKVPSTSTSQSRDNEQACPSDNQWCSDLINVYDYKKKLLNYQNTYHTRCIGAGKKGSAEDTHASEKHSAHMVDKKKRQKNEPKGNPKYGLGQNTNATPEANPIYANMYEHTTSGNDNVRH